MKQDIWDAWVAQWAARVDVETMVAIMAKARECQVVLPMEFQILQALIIK
jgi:hypothetical protein